jgi:hypothetical protein
VSDSPSSCNGSRAMVGVWSVTRRKGKFAQDEKPHRTLIRDLVDFDMIPYYVESVADSFQRLSC